MSNIVHLTAGRIGHRYVHMMCAPVWWRVRGVGVLSFAWWGVKLTVVTMSCIVRGGG